MNENIRDLDKQIEELQKKKQRLEALARAKEIRKRIEIEKKKNLKQKPIGKKTVYIKREQQIQQPQQQATQSQQRKVGLRDLSWPTKIMLVVGTIGATLVVALFVSVMYSTFKI